jgi:two-component system response regulator FixJ
MQQNLVHILIAGGKERGFIARCLTTQGLTFFLIEDVWEFLRFPDSSKAACLLLDISLPGLDGLEIMSRAQAAGYLLPPTIMLGPEDVSLATRAIKQGASDYLTRPLSEVALINAVMSYIDPSRQDMDSDPRRNFLSTLTKRERQVLAALANGKSAADAGQMLGVKTETINFHGTNLRKKAEVATTPELVAKALRGGFMV